MIYTEACSLDANDEGFNDDYGCDCSDSDNAEATAFLGYNIFPIRTKATNLTFADDQKYFVAQDLFLIFSFFILQRKQRILLLKTLNDATLCFEGFELAHLISQSNQQ